MVAYIFAKFGAEWLIFVDDIESKQSQIWYFFQIQEQITPNVLLRFDP